MAALVARLDGLPLAIELAAAKVRAMSVAQIARRLGDRFALLSGHDRSAPDRHQTLEAVIAWSWNLLDEEDQHAMRTLAVFPDGFSLEGAEALLERDPVPALTELVDQSLLVVREGDRLRYRFLETVREYGLKELESAGRTTDVHERLRGWAVALARELVAGLFSATQIEAMHDTRAEAGNLAGVMREAVEAQDAAAVVPLVAALAGFGTIEGEHLGVMQMAREVIDLVVAAPEPGPELEGELRGVLAVLIVTTTLFTGEPAPAAVARLQALGLAGDHSRSDALARLLLEVYADGQPSLEALDRLCESDDPTLARIALQWATQARENAGDLDGALEAARRGLALCDDSDGPWTRALYDSQVTGLAAQTGDWEGAIEHASRAIPVMRALGAHEDVMQLRASIAFADIAQGRLDEAARVIDDIAADERLTASVGWGVSSLTGEAELALARGETETGLRLLLDCVDTVSQRQLPGVDAPGVMMPWVLYAEASALFAHVLHGHRDEAAWVAARVREKLPTAAGRADAHHRLPGGRGSAARGGHLGAHRRSRAAAGRGGGPDGRPRPPLRLPPRDAHDGLVERGRRRRVPGSRPPRAAGAALCRRTLRRPARRGPRRRHGPGLTSYEVVAVATTSYDVRGAHIARRYARTESGAKIATTIAQATSAQPTWAVTAPVFARSRTAVTTCETGLIWTNFCSQSAASPRARRRWRGTSAGT